MTKIFKRLMMLCLPAVLMMAFASCEKSDSDGQDLSNSLVGTVWKMQGSESTLAFTTASSGICSIDASSVIDFTYTYSNGSGTITMMGGTGTFTVSGNTMVMISPTGVSATWTLVSGGNNNNPSAITSLVGTQWAMSMYEGSAMVRLSFTTASNVTLFASHDDEIGEIETTYSYSNGSGIIYAPEGESGNLPFTVSGNHLYLTVEGGETWTFTRQ